MGYSKKETRIRTIFAISNFGDFVGGGEYSFLDLISCMGTQYNPVVILPRHGQLISRIQNKNITAKIIHLSKVRPWYLPSILISIRCLVVAAKNANATLVYANGTRPTFYGGIVSKILKIPLIWHCRIAEKDHWLDPVLARFTNLIIVNSCATAKRFSEQTQKKIRIIHNGFDIQWLQDKNISSANIKTQKNRIILTVARISRIKRHDLAIDAFEETAKVYPDIHLVIVGSKDPYESEWWDYLHKKTADSCYADRIHWIGHVEDVRPWYRAATILLFPSQNEAFGRVVVEAMASGIPVVASNSGGVPEIIRDGKEGILVPFGKSHELACAIKSILEDEEISIKMGKSGAERAKEFSLESHKKEIICAFDEAIGIARTNLPIRHKNISKFWGN